MNVHLYGDINDTIVRLCLDLVLEKGHGLSNSPLGVDVAVAPLMRRKITPDELAGPRMGTLVFHPSLLPIHRGRDAIRWAFFFDEKYTGATWFWADEGYDTGDICEQEVLPIQHGEAPRQFYERAVIPSALRLLRFAMDDLAAGIVRRRPQVHEHATYEGPFSSRPRRVTNL